jgi:hypothetical protein
VAPTAPSSFYLVSFNSTSAQFQWTPPVNTDLRALTSYSLQLVAVPSPDSATYHNASAAPHLTCAEALSIQVSGNTTTLQFSAYTFIASVAQLTPLMQYQATLYAANRYGSTPTLTTFSFTAPAGL